MNRYKKSFFCLLAMLVGFVLVKAATSDTALLGWIGGGLMLGGALVGDWNS